MKEIDDLKSQSREADAVARDAEANHRHLVAQMAELRRLADEAENKARSLSEKPTKKKGMFSSGKAKKVDVVRKTSQLGLPRSLIIFSRFSERTGTYHC
jgi:hypothetical protein